MPSQQDEEKVDAQELNVEQLLADALSVRTGMGLPASELPTWLASLDGDQVKRGRQAFWRLARLLRRFAATDQEMPGSNLLTLGGLSAREIATYFRESPGRPTPAQVLGAVIAQVMVYAAIEEAVGVPWPERNP